MRYRPYSAVALGAACLLASALCVAQVQDVALKAAFIYNFALFTTWPQEASEPDRFKVCAPRSSPMWDSLLKLNGKLVEGKAWTLTDVVEEGPGQCRIIVLSGPPLPFDTDTASGALIVDDGTAEAPSSAVITLVKEATLIRFDVDTGKAARRGLTFSSKLLRLARSVS